jgi:hypothetical protein
MEAILLIFLFFLILLALKLAAVALVYHLGPIVVLPIIVACIIIAYRIEPTSAKPE